MKNNSFTSKIKDEILNYNWSREQLSVLFYSFLRTNGIYKNGNYVVSTTLINWEKKINEMFKDFYNLDIKPIKLKTKLKYEISNPIFLEKFTSEVGDLIISSVDNNKAYIAGAFIGKAWVSLPSSRFYHFEIRVRHLSHSLDIQEAFDGLGIRTTTINKSNWFYTYVKKSTEISNILRIVHANESLMTFEDWRIERDFLATFKKMESIENYNLEKSSESSQKQIKAIKFIEEKKSFKNLNESKINLAILRKENPNYSLSELQMEYNNIYDSNISKSTINNWLKQFITISKEVEN